MKTKLEKELRAQWNTRVRTPYIRAAKVAAAIADTNQDSIAELALQVLLGVEDEAGKQRRVKIVAAWKNLGEKLPFNNTTLPLAS
jgi:hypothetical protein